MTEPVSMEEYAEAADRRIREAAETASRDIRNFSLPYIDEPRPKGVDWNFVQKEEGERYLEAYVPARKGIVLDESGVTIASGFDLGQHNAADLKGMGLYQGLIDRLTPYMKSTLRGAPAKEYLQKNPLRISDEEARLIDRRAQIKSYDALASRYNAATQKAYGEAAAPRFQDIPRGAQTAIADVAFQYGSLPDKTPNFWQQVTTGQWDAAHDNLMNFGDKYGPRREREAGLLAGDLRAGRLPAAPQSKLRDR